MSTRTNVDQAIELLQQLGLKEYEAKAFVALSRLPQGTAKDISEISDVPRTRVYDAVRVLESKGLVEIQHSNPQQFRAVSLEEAAGTLRREYESRTQSLREALSGLEPAATEDDTDVTHEVWSLTGTGAIQTRTRELVTGANDEVVFVLGHESVLTEDLLEALRSVQETGVTLFIGVVDEDLAATLRESLPEATVFVSGLDWLRGSPLADDETVIGRLVLVDRSAILVSSFRLTDAGDHRHEQAVFGRGFDNGLVTIVRRLMATGLLPGGEPSEVDAGLKAGE